MNARQGDLPRDLTLPMVFCVALKQVIGGGVIVLTGTAMALTGAGAAPAYAIACMVVLLVSLPYAILGAAVPVSGSLYRWPARFIGPIPAFLAFWMVLGTHVGLAAYAATFGAALHMLVPVVPARLAGVAAVGLVLIINLRGAEVSARAGIAVTLVTASCLLALAAAGLPHIEPARLANMLPHGWHGLLAAAALLTFPIGGATLVSELGGEMRHPGRDIPIAILGATATAAGLYVAVALVAAGLSRPNGSLDQVAQAVMGPIGRTLFGVGTGIVSMLGIINAHFLWGSRSILMVCRDGWLPTGLGRPNKNGAPTWPLLALTVIGITPILTGLDVADIIRVSALGATGSAILSVACAPLFARQNLDAYRRSPLAIPRWALHGAVAAAVAAQVATICVILRDLPVRLILLWLLWLATGLAIALVRKSRERA